MKLFLLTQTEVDGLDTYDSAVVCASSASKAKDLHPNGEKKLSGSTPNGDWATSRKNVKAKLIGEARSTMPAGVVCASFNAG